MKLVEIEPGRWRFIKSTTPPARSNLPLPYIISDSMPPTEQVDGKFYTSKSAFRAIGKSLGLTEVGNEKFKPRQRASEQASTKKARREAVGKAVSLNTAQAAAFKEMRRKVDAFAKTHARFDELAEQIQYWLEKGLRLDEAYLVADTLRPSRRKMIEEALKRMGKAP